jgi:hypothetical protein
MTNSIRQRVEAAAQRLGASRAAIFKWRQRGIPAEWKLKLAVGPDAIVTVSELNEYEQPTPAPSHKPDEAA